MEQEKLASNIKKIFWLNGTFSFLVLMPVIVPFFKSRGLNMAQVYQLQAIFAFFVLVLEVPSGYFSDLFGRKKTLMTASVFHCLGFGVMAFAPDFWGMVVAEVFIAVAISLFSGTDLSLLYDSIAGLEKGGAPIKRVGQNVFFRQAGESVAGLVGGWLVLYHFEAPAWAQALVGVMPLLIAGTLYEPPREKLDKKKHRDNLKHIARSLFGQSLLLNLILISGIFYSFVTLIAVWAFQEYWREVEIPLHMFGYLWFAINITVGVTARYAHKIEKRLGSVAVLLIMGAFPIVGFFGLSWVQAAWGAVFCLLFQVVRGLNSVVLADGLNKRIGSEMRATANSIMGLGTRILMIGLGPVVGWMIDTKGLSEANSFLGFMYIAVFFFTLLPLLTLRKQYHPIR